MIIILDNGHGQETEGKRSPKGLLTDPEKTALYEFEFNRDVVCRIDSILTKKGYDVHRLVPELNDVSLPERVKRANYLHKSNECILISIHANAFNGKAEGFEAFTYLGQSESDIIAEFILKEAQERLPFRMRFDLTDGDLDKESRFYILKHTSMPAVLTESGFMDNPDDLAYIISDEGRQEIASVHADAIIKYLNN